MRQKPDRFFYQKLYRLTAPIVLQSLMLAMVAAADAFMLGSMNQSSMAAVSLATQVQFVQNIFVYSIVSAVTILGAQYWGKKDEKTLNAVFMMGLKVSVVISFIFFIGCFCFPRYLMLIFTDEPELIEIGMQYLRIAGWSYLLTGISQCYLTLMKVSDHTKQTAIISSCTVVLNIILNAILIFGLFGLPKMGVRGAALATLIARIVELAWCIQSSYRKEFFTPKFHVLFDRNKVLAMDFTSCLLPLIGAGALWGIGFTSYTAFMGHMGGDAAAANSVAAVVRDLLCCMANGISSGGGIMVGNELGAGKLDTGKMYGNWITKIAFVCGFGCTAVMILLTPLVVRFVKLTPQAEKYLWGMMIIMAIYMIGRTVNTIVINGVFAAGGDTLFDMYSLAVTMWMIAVPLAAAGTFFLHWPVLVVYACTCLDEVGKIPWVMYHYKKYKWVKDLTR